MSQLSLFANLATERLVTRDGGTVELPALIMGDTRVCTLRLLEPTETELRERQLNVRSLRASVGRVMEPPTSGTFTLRTLDETGTPGTVTIPPSMGRWLIGVRIFVAGDEGETTFEFDVVNETTLADGVAEIATASATAGKITATIDGDGAAVISAVDPDYSITVDYAAFAPDDPGLDSQPVSVTGNATPPTHDRGPDCTPISWNASATDFATKLSPVLPVALGEIYTPAPGCWLFRLSNNSRIGIEGGGKNRLDPISFVRTRWFERFEGEWWCEVRLIQTPVAFASSFDRVLPPAPTVERVRAGATRIVGSSANTNEVQKLYIPPEFEGTYTLKFDYHTTRLLGTVDDGEEEIAVALNEMYPDGKERFKATNPEDGYAYIEFTGPLAETPQPLITTMVHTFAPGVLTFSLDLNRQELHAILRDKAEVDLTLEIELEVVDDDEDAADPAIPGRWITICQEKVRVVREQIFEELAQVQSIDWVRPPQPRDYIPFSREQIITGQQHYSAVFGNGALRGFSFPYNLGTAAISGFVVRENKARGRFLVHGRDYELTSGDDPANELLLDIPEEKPVPALNSLAITITTAGPKSAFQQHGHAMGEVSGLTEFLEAYGERLTNIENKIPYTVPGVRTEGAGESEVFPIDDYYAIFPGRYPKDADFKLPKMPARLSALLPAIHDATIDNLTEPLPEPDTATGKVFKNAGATEIFIPGGLGHRGSSLKPNGYAGCDGRIWYPLSRDGATNSFYPADFEREFFVRAVNDRMLRPGGEISIEFTLAAQLLGANTVMQAVLVIEVGDVPQQNTPAPVGVNLSDVTWSATPLLSQRIILSNQKAEAKFGTSIKRGTDNVMSADRLLYGIWEAAGTQPASANFAIRARLIEWDTENSIANATGAVWVGFTNAKATLTNA